MREFFELSLEQGFARNAARSAAAGKHVLPVQSSPSGCNAAQSAALNGEWKMQMHEPISKVR